MGKDFNTIFMGTPDFAVPVLEQLAARTNLRLVITQPDRPVGRGKKMQAPPVKVAAEQLGIEVLQPQVVKGKKFSSKIAAYEPHILVTAAFGRILGPSLLQVPTVAALNVHASILPFYRGAAPINWAILKGEKEAGVSIMTMVPELDAGAVYRVAKTEIGPDETAGELTVRLSHLGAAALGDVVDDIENIQPVEQNHQEATWAPVLKKSDGEIDWNRTAVEIHAHVRGMSPWPGATAQRADCIVKVHRAAVLESGGVHAPLGTIVAHSRDGIDVACGKGLIRMTEVQLPGKKKIDACQAYAGCRFDAGELLT